MTENSRHDKAHQNLDKTNKKADSPNKDLRKSDVDGILAVIPYACVLLDDSFNCIDCNAAAVSLLGFTDGQNLLDNQHKIFSNAQPDGTLAGVSIQNHISEALMSGNTVFQLIAKYADDRTFDAEIAFSCIKTTDGNMYLVCIRDVSDFNTEILRLSHSFNTDLRLMIESMPGIVTFWNEKSELIHCNQGAAGFFGLSGPQEYLERFGELSPPTQPCGTKSLKKALQYVNDGLRDGFVEFDWMHQKPDGTPMPCYVTLTRVIWHDNYGLVGFAHDMRERNAAAKRGIEEEQRFSLMLNTLPNPCMFWNDKLEIVMFNEAAVEIFGFHKEQSNQERFIKINPTYQPDGRQSNEAVIKELSHALEHGRNQFEWMHKTMYGEMMPCEITLMRIDWQGGHGITAFVRDMRQEYQERTQRIKDEKQYYAVLDNVPGSVHLWAVDGTNLYSNRFMVDVLGYTGINDLAKGSFIAFPELQPNGKKSLEVHSHAIRSAVKYGRFKTEFTVQTANGESIHMDCTFVKVDWQGRYAVLEFARDMREQFQERRAQKAFQERLRLVLDSMPTGSSLISPDQTVIDCNQAVVELYGLADKQEYIRRFLELSPQHQPCGTLSADLRTKYYTQAIERGSFTVNWMNQKPDGTPIPTRVTIVAIEWEGKTILCNFTQDMRPQLAEMLAKDAETDKLRTMLDASPTVCIIVSPDGDFIDCNNLALELFEIEDKETFGKMLLKLQPERQAGGVPTDMALQRAKEVILSKERHADLWTFKTMSGELLPTFVSTFRTTFEGEPVVLMYLQDRREIMHIRHEQQQLRAQITAMVNASPMMCFICTEDFELIDCNQQALSLTGFEDSRAFVEGFGDILASQIPKLEIAFRDGTHEWEWDCTMQNSYAASIPLGCNATRVEIEGRNTLVVYCRDLRNRNRYVAEQRRIRERLDAVLDASPIACVVRDGKFRLIDCNQAALQLFGFETKEDFFNGYDSRHSEYQSDGVLSAYKLKEYHELVSEKGGAQFRWIFRNPDGTEIMGDATVRQIVLDEEDYYIAYIENKSDFINIEKERHIFRQRLQVIIDASPLASVITNNKLETIMCNNAAVSLFRLESKQELFQRFGELSPRHQPDGTLSQQRAVSIMQHFFKHNSNGSATQTIEFEWMHQTIDGEPLPCNVTFKSVNVDGAWMLMCYMRDLRDLHYAIETGETFEKQAFVDETTGAYNRRYFDELVTREFSKSVSAGRDFALMQLNVDNYSDITDAHGTDVGSKALQIMTSRIKNTLRKDAVVVRYDESRFIIMVSSLNSGDGIKTANRIRDSITATMYKVGRTNPVPVINLNVSIGIAELPGDSGGLWMLLANSATAMEEAQSRGGNEVVQFGGGH